MRRSFAANDIVTARKVAWYGDFELFLHLFRNDQDRASLDKGIANPQEPGRRESWNARSIHVSAICTMTATKAWAGTATTKRRSGKDTAISSLSLGAERRFSLRHKRKGDSPSISIATIQTRGKLGTGQISVNYQLGRSRSLV